MSAANAKRWVIIRTDRLAERENGEHIEPNDRPTFVHETSDQAEAELLRLESTHGHSFALFESVAFAREVSAYAGGKLITAHIVEKITE